MKANILSKLRRVLESRAVTEVEVVYLMVAIRKLLDWDNLKGKYRRLAFFCDWALHTKMDRTSTVQLINQFDDIYDSHWSKGKTGLDEEIGHEIGDLTSGDSLRQELRAFLESSNLPSAICNDSDLWHCFMKEYSNVITDCPLEYNLIPIKHIKSIIVRRVDPDIEMYGPGGIYARFGLEWRLRFVDRDEDYVRTCYFVS